MSESEYIVHFEFMDSARDPRLEQLGFESFLVSDARVNQLYYLSKLDSNVKRFVVDSIDDSKLPAGLRQQEQIKHLSVSSEDLKEMMIRHMLRRFTVGLLDDQSIPDYLKFKTIESLKLLVENIEGDFEVPEDTDEITLQEICRFLIECAVLVMQERKKSTFTSADKLHINVMAKITQNLFQKCPVIERWNCPPLCTIENGDLNTWVLTSFYPTPMQHQLFLGAPVEIQTASGLRCQVSVECRGAPQIAIL